MSQDDTTSDVDVRSKRAKTRIVRVDTSDPRAWLVDEPVCPLLKQYHIVHAGIASMPSPFEIVRTNLAGTFFLACLGGEGRVSIGGQFRRCRPGQAFLLPPGTRHAFHTLKGKTWKYCHVRFLEVPGQQPVASASSPVMAEYDGKPLRTAIEGLYHECANDGAQSQIGKWADLVYSYVMQFAEPREIDPRIWQLWEEVKSDLPHAWTSAEMADKVHLSEKQLERLCRRELGRTPRQQLIWLRLRRAAELLADSDRKIASIAHEVGYENPFVFSSAFKRCMGWSPSEHPSRNKTRSPRTGRR